jgi:hypothetical protein
VGWGVSDKPLKNFGVKCTGFGCWLAGFWPEGGSPPRGGGGESPSWTAETAANSSPFSFDLGVERSSDLGLTVEPILRVLPGRGSRRRLFPGKCAPGGLRRGPRNRSEARILSAIPAKKPFSCDFVISGAMAQKTNPPRRPPWTPNPDNPCARAQQWRSKAQTPPPAASAEVNFTRPLEWSSNFSRN